MGQHCIRIAGAVFFFINIVNFLTKWERKSIAEDEKRGYNILGKNLVRLLTLLCRPILISLGKWRARLWAT